LPGSQLSGRASREFAGNVGTMAVSLEEISCPADKDEQNLEGLELLRGPAEDMIDHGGDEGGGLGWTSRFKLTINGDARWIYSLVDM
jgi:hypothetical protein